VLKIKVRHHCHVSGNFLFPACNNCSLQLQTTGCKRKATSSQNSNDNKKIKLETDEDFFLPVVFHNLKSYDEHFILKHFKKEYTERKKADGKPPTYDDVIVKCGHGLWTTINYWICLILYNVGYAVARKTANSMLVDEPDRSVIVLIVIVVCGDKKDSQSQTR